MIPHRCKKCNKCTWPGFRVKMADYDPIFEARYGDWEYYHKKCFGSMTIDDY